MWAGAMEAVVRQMLTSQPQCALLPTRHGITSLSNRLCEQVHCSQLELTLQHHAGHTVAKADIACHCHREVENERLRCTRQHEWRAKLKGKEKQVVQCRQDACHVLINSVLCYCCGIRLRMQHFQQRRRRQQQQQQQQQPNGEAGNGTTNSSGWRTPGTAMLTALRICVTAEGGCFMVSWICTSPSWF